jgi:hypothetical protein
VVDFLFLQRAANPRRRFILPEIGRLAGVDGFDSGVARGGDQRRSVSDQRRLVERSARLVVLHVPYEEHRAGGLDDLAQLRRDFSSFEIDHGSRLLVSFAILHPDGRADKRYGHDAGTP